MNITVVERWMSALLARLRMALLLGSAFFLTVASEDPSQDPKFVPPPRRRPDGFRKLPYEDRQVERHQDEIRWMGGQPAPAHQEYKKRIAAEHLERFAASFPGKRAPGVNAPVIQSPNTVTWTCIGPTKGVSSYSGINNPDIDSGRIAPNGLAISPDGKTLYLASATGGLWKTTTADKTNADAAWAWTPLTDTLPIASSTGNIPIGAVALSPSGATLFIGSGDFAASFGKGFYRSTDSGITWTETSRTGLCGLYASDYISCIFPVDENTVLAGGNAGLYRSTDGGATFGIDAIGNRVLGSNGYGDRIWSVEQVGSSSQNLVASLEITGNPATGTAWYSSDGGATWNQASITGTGATPAANIGRITLKSNKASGNLNVWGIAHITPGPTMFKGVFLSTDGGRNYTYVPDASSPAALFAISGDGGQGNYNQCLAVSQAETSVSATKVFTGSNCGFYRSSDGGVTWTWMTNWYSWPNTPVYSHADKHAAIWSPDGTTLYVGTDGGLSVFWDPFRATPPIRQPGNPPLTDPTFVDNRHNEGLSTHLVYHLGSTNAISPAGSNARVTIGLQDNSVRRRTGAPLASSTQYDETYASGDGFGTLIHKSDGDRFIFSGYADNLGYSMDGGVTYHGASITVNDTTPFHTRVEPGRADSFGNTAYTASNFKLFRSTDFGQSWTACGMGGFPSSGVSYIRNFNTSSIDPLKLAIVDATHCWISADGGATWIDKGAVYAAGGVEVALSYIWFDSTNDNILYAASAYAGWGPTIQHLWRSADGGATWQNIEGGGFPSGHGVTFGGPVHIIQNDPGNSSTLLAGTDFGIYVSTDSGSAWSRHGVGLPMVGVHDFYLAPDGSFIRAATYGRGVWESTGAAGNPRILAQPADTTAYEGLDTSFSVQASGAYAYQWQVNDGSGWVNTTNSAPYSGATTAALTLTGITAGLNGYHYQVVVTGVTGAGSPTITSTSVALTVVPPPSPNILTQPSNTTVATGATGHFTVQASGAASYQWQVNTGAGGWTNLVDGAPYSGATTASLAITGATLGMSTYQYQVVLTGAAAAVPRTVTSASATLTVVAAPAFTSQPGNATVMVGANASFTATVTGATSYRWQSKVAAGPWTDLSDGGVYSGAITTSLTITAAPSGMDGTTYRLIATGPLALTTTSNTVTLFVKDAAAITVQPANASSPFNAQTRFTVTATGYVLTYQWQVNPNTGIWSSLTDGVNVGGSTTSSLSIWVSTTMNGYQYRVIVTGAVGTPVISSAVTLTVQCTPVITSQPLDRAVDVGGTTSFTMTASSAVQYNWKVNKNDGLGFVAVPYAAPYSGNGTATLTITGAPAGMNGYGYEAQVFGCGSPVASIYSSAATLWVGVAPNITAQPGNATVTVGANTTFSVTATGASSYQWQVNTGSGFTNITNTSPYAGATSATLSITGATAGMNGFQYQVMVTGSAAAVPHSVTSIPATLTVNAPPSITGQPANASVNAGGSTSFTVTASGTGLTYQWQVNTSAGYANVADGGVYAGATAATLAISGASAGMNGYQYQVVVTGVVAPVAISNAATLTVNVPPSISTQPASRAVTVGGSTSFTVAAAGTSLSFQWQANTGAGFANVSNGGVYAGASTASLVITGATAGMNGSQYQVVVSGAAAPAVISNPATLTVNVPPSISVQPASISVTVGGNTSFSVSASGTGLSYQWQVNTGGGFGNVTNGGVYAGATTASLAITGASSGMSGYLYRVVVSGAAAPAVTSIAATLTVIVPPSISTQPASASVTAGGNTSFFVTASGTGLSYQWQVNIGSGYANVSDGGVYAGATAATLAITGASTGMNGYLYQVVVSGVVAPTVTSTAATLTVSLKPLDLNADGVANVLDLAEFFRRYAPGVLISNSPADFNGDGYVDDTDLAILLAGL